MPERLFAYLVDITRYRSDRSKFVYDTIYKFGTEYLIFVVLHVITIRLNHAKPCKMVLCSLLY